MRSSWSFTFNSPVFFLKNTFEFAFHTARSAFAGGVFMEKGIESKNFHKIYLVVQWVGEVVSNRRCVVQILHSNLSFFFLSFLLLFCFAGIFVLLFFFFIYIYIFFSYWLLSLSFHFLPLTSALRVSAIHVLLVYGRLSYYSCPI